MRKLQALAMNNIPAYVYYIKHIPSGKFYYGSRYRHIENEMLPEQDLWKIYFSSSKEIAKLRKETGDSSFEHSIIFTDSNTEKCFDYEQTLIKENIKNPLCINKRYFDSAKGTKVFSTYGKTLSSKGKPKSEETKEKMRKPKSAAHKKTMSERQKARGGNGPKEHSQETKYKIKIAGIGRVHTDATKTLIGLSHKGIPKPTVVCPICKKVGSKGPMHRFHFDNCKLKDI